MYMCENFTAYFGVLSRGMLIINFGGRKLGEA